MAIHDCIGGLAPDMDIIAEAVRVGFVKCHEAQPIGEQSAMPLEKFCDEVLRVLTTAEARAALPDLPKRGEFDVRRALDSAYFFC